MPPIRCVFKGCEANLSHSRPFRREEAGPTAPKLRSLWFSQQCPDLRIETGGIHRGVKDVLHVAVPFPTLTVTPTGVWTCACPTGKVTAAFPNPSVAPPNEAAWNLKLAVTMTGALATVDRMVAVSLLLRGGLGLDIETTQMPSGSGETADPKNDEEPNVNTPPSDATRRYPDPAPLPSIPTTGWLRRMFPVEP